MFDSIDRNSIIAAANDLVYGFLSVSIGWFVGLFGLIFFYPEPVNQYRQALNLLPGQAFFWFAAIPAVVAFIAAIIIAIFHHPHWDEDLRNS